MTRLVVYSPEAPLPDAPISQGIVSGGFLYTAGFGPVDAATGDVVGDSIEDQTHKVMQNLKHVLDAHGLDFSHVVKVTAHLSDATNDMPGFNKVYREYMSEPYPARTTVGSVLPRFLVEVDVVATAR